MNYIGSTPLTQVGYGTGSVRAIFSSSGDFTFIQPWKEGLLSSSAYVMSKLNTASYDVDVGQERAAVNTGATSTIAFSGTAGVYKNWIALVPSGDTTVVTKFGVYDVTNNKITSSMWTSPTNLRCGEPQVGADNKFHCFNTDWAAGAINNSSPFYRMDPELIGKSSVDVVTSSQVVPSASYRYGQTANLLQFNDGYMYAPPTRGLFPYLLKYEPNLMSSSYEPIHIPTSASCLTGGAVRGAFFSHDYTKLFWHMSTGNVVYVNMQTKTGSFVVNCGDMFRFIRSSDGNALVLGTNPGSSAYRINLTASLVNPTSTNLGSNPGQSNMGLIIGNDGRVYILPYWTSAVRKWYAYDPVYTSGSANWRPPITGAFNGAGFRSQGAVLHQNGNIYTYSQYEKFILAVPTTGSYSTYGYAGSAYATSS